MERRSFLEAAGVMTVAGVAGCLGSHGGGADVGSVEVELLGHFVSAEPFSRLVLTVDGIRLVGEGRGARAELGDVRVDLATADGQHTLGPVQVAPGKYRSIGVDVSGVGARLQRGTSVDVRLPEAPIRFEEQVYVEAGRSTSISLTIAPVHLKGGEYVLRPGYLANCWCA